MTSTSREQQPDPAIAKGKAAPANASADKRDSVVDEALKETFPASDPPSYMGGAVTGGPKKHPSTSTSTPAEADKP